MIRNDLAGTYKDAPEWVLASELYCAVCGSGMAQIEDDKESSLNEAVDNARSQLYVALNRRIRACLNEFFKKNSVLENEAFARMGEIISSEAAQHFMTTETWISKDKEIFVLVVSDLDVIRDAFKKKLMDFLKARNLETIDPDNPKIQEEIDKLANKHFREFTRL